MKVLAVIPGRAGSKGVPGKNVRPFHGKPLLCYSIESALESELIDTIVVSSDGNHILNVAESYEGVKLHKRAAKHASDVSPIADTLIQILAQEQQVDYLVLLQPTSPLRTGKQIDEAIRLLEARPKANSVISVIRMDDIHPARMYWKGGKDILSPIMKEFVELRRQEIPPAFYRNGSIYVTRAQALLKHRSVMVPPNCAYEMSIQTWLNIDDQRDVLMAEVMIKAWKEGSIK